MKPNALAMRLNVRAWRLSYEYHIQYESARTHAGRSISLTLEEPQFVTTVTAVTAFRSVEAGV